MLQLAVSAKGPRNILVRGVNWIGDAVMTMPAIRAVRRSDPDSRITLLVRPWVAPLFEKDPNVDEIILYSDEYKGIAGRIRLAGDLRGRVFDTALLLQNALDAAVITFLAGIPERTGYSRDARRVLLTKPVSCEERERKLHHIEYYLNLAEKAGFAAERTLPWIYLSLDERMRARAMLKGLRHPVVGINPGATFGSSKRWPPGRFAGIAGRITAQMNGSVVIFGGPSEKEISGEIMGSLDPSVATSGSLLDLAGRTSLRELAALISECDVLVTNDSGPMHIGYAVGTPLVAIFGSTSPELTGPAGEGNIVIKKGTACSPCFERECKDSSLKCMDLITEDEVFGAVKKLVGTKRAIFFDRDGTLCRDAHYLNRMEDFELFPDIGSLKRLKEKGYCLVGITNQSGIARCLVDEEFVKKVNSLFVDEHGFDAFYYCPHHPGEHCSCRKPEPGLLFRARADLGIDLKRSFVIGDKDIDMLLAKAVGAAGIHVRTGQEGTSANADFTVKDLTEAVDMIEKHV